MNLHGTKSSSCTGGFGFAIPWVIGLVLLTLLPAAASIIMACYEWDGLSFSSGAKWVGLTNYSMLLFDDPQFKRALNNSLLYSLIGTPLSVGAALGAAVLLSKPVRGIGFFRTIFYLPHVLGGVATVMIWSWLLNPRFGPINEGLRMIYQLIDPLARLWQESGTTKWPRPGWLYSPEWCKPALILMQIWSLGGAMLIFLAALQHVPKNLGEAACLDGANRWRQFWHVTWPVLTPAILFNVVTGLVASMQSFNQAYLLYNRSQDDGLLFYVLYLYRCAFEPPYRVGYASAMAWIFFGIVFGLILLAVRSARGWVYYEGQP